MVDRNRDRKRSAIDHRARTVSGSRMRYDVLIGAESEAQGGVVMSNWSEHEQAELARQAEWLRREREQAKPKAKPKLLGRLKALFGPKE